MRFGGVYSDVPNRPKIHSDPFVLLLLSPVIARYEPPGSNQYIARRPLYRSPIEDLHIDNGGRGLQLGLRQLVPMVKTPMSSLHIDDGGRE